MAVTRSTTVCTMSWPAIALVSTVLGFLTMPCVMPGTVAGSDGWRNFFFTGLSSVNVCFASLKEPLVDGSPVPNGMMSTSLMIGGPAMT